MVRKRRIERPVRTTYLLPTVLDANVGIVAVRRKISKAEAYRTAIEDLCRKEGLDPERIPKKIIVEY